MESPLLQLQVCVTGTAPKNMSLWSDNLFTMLQIDALLSETCLQPDEHAAAQDIVEQVQNTLQRIKPHQV